MGKEKSGRLDVGDRMKRYEAVTNTTLSPRVPVIIRVDGKSFHTCTRKKYGKQYELEFLNAMQETAVKTMSQIQGCNFCYSQSDEISFLVTDYETIKTDRWFNYELRKMVSISASYASVYFSDQGVFPGLQVFDSRAFNMPQDDVVNYFIWRQLDATRNAIQMAARENFSHKELHKKSCSDIQEMLFQSKGINFNDYPATRKRGFCVINGKIDNNIPIFTKNRSYIENFIYTRID